MDVTSWIVPNVRSTCPRASYIYLYFRVSCASCTFVSCLRGNSSITVIQQLKKCTVHRKSIHGFLDIGKWNLEVEGCILGLPLVLFFCRHQCQAHEFVQGFTLCLVCVFLFSILASCSRFEVFYPCSVWQRS